MSELPREAQALLALAKDAHDPPDGDARDRVRRGVAIVLAAGAGTAVAGKAVAGATLMGKASTPGAVKLGMFASLGAKLAAATTVAVVVGAAAIAVPHVQSGRHTPKARERATMAPSQHVVAAPQAVPDATPQQLYQPSELSPAAAALPIALPEQASGAAASSDTTRDVVAKRKQRTKSTTDLAAEMRLLHQASDALAAKQTRRALVLLKQHRARFAAPALSEERDGLSALAQCTLNPAKARHDANMFLARAPSSLLAARIKKACLLPGGAR